jgi:geranylgeranyl pyrophosphate synthase
MVDTSLEEAAAEGALRLIAEYSATEEQAKLLGAAVEGWLFRYPGVGSESYRRPVRLALAVCNSVCGEPERALPLGTMLILLRTGADALDDLMDGDVRPWWNGYQRADVLLAGATLLSTLTQLALASFDVTPSTRIAMLRWLARAGLELSAGQQYDIAAAGRDDVTLTNLEHCAEQKSGASYALAARLSAELAGAAHQQVQSFERLGRALGVASQFSGDVYDTCVAGDGRDLQNGAPTLPIVLYRDALAGAPRVAFVALLARARTDRDARIEVRRLLREAGTVRACAMIVERYCQVAYTAISETKLPVERMAALRRLVRDVSLLPE